VFLIIVQIIFFVLISVLLRQQMHICFRSTGLLVTQRLTKVQK